jgi:ketosteroid isomerase-like protein
MSQENVEGVRQQVAVKGHPRRGVEERLLRFPRAVAFLVRAVERLPPSSRLRQVLLRRAFQAGVAALNRGSPEVAFAIYHVDCEFELGKLAPVGLEGTRGREDRIRFQQRWNAEWGDFRFELEEVRDLGDHRALIVGRIKGAGLSSGAEFDNEWAALFTLSSGWIIREEAFLDHAEALQAVGRSE